MSRIAADSPVFPRSFDAYCFYPGNGKASSIRFSVESGYRGDRSSEDASGEGLANEVVMMAQSLQYVRQRLRFPAASRSNCLVTLNYVFAGPCALPCDSEGSVNCRQGGHAHRESHTRYPDSFPGTCERLQVSIDGPSCKDPDVRQAGYSGRVRCALR